MKSQYPRSGQVSNTTFHKSCVARPKMEAKIGKTTPDSERPKSLKRKVKNTLFFQLGMNGARECI